MTLKICFKNGEWWWIKKNYIKNCMSYYFHDLIKTEDFDLDKVLLDEKPFENILV